MEFTAIEAEEVAPAIEYWQVWFREEYFGKVPEELIPDVAVIMAGAGGLAHDPTNLRLEAWHRPAAYSEMVRAIVDRLNRWMLENNRTEI